MTQEELPTYIKKDDVYNTAVILSLEWGENWRQPIQHRLRKHFPEISEEEADHLDNHCREMMNFAIRLAEKYFFEHVYSQEEATHLLRQEYPKLEENALNVLFAQAVWYAAK